MIYVIVADSSKSRFFFGFQLYPKTKHPLLKLLHYTYFFLTNYIQKINEMLSMKRKLKQYIAEKLFLPMLKIVFTTVKS